MDININQLIDYFAQATLNLINVFPAKVEAQFIDTGRATAPQVNGLVIATAGSAYFKIDKTTYTLQPGAVLHAPPQKNLVIEALNQQAFSYIVIHYEVLKQAINDPFSTEHYAIPVNDAEEICYLAKQLHECYAQFGSMAMLRAKTRFANLIESILYGAKVHYTSTNHDVIEQALQYIHDNYASDLSVAQLAEICHLERRRFTHLFEQYTGMNPSTYITEYRITRAKALLRAFKNPISEIAEYVGYADSFYFSRVFKKITGLSPSQYRMQGNKN